jgi:hypothetical protein
MRSPNTLKEQAWAKHIAKEGAKYHLVKQHLAKQCVQQV